MAQMLTSAARLRTAGNVDVEITDLIGSGGQGEVYRVTVGGRSMALKWYFPRAATPEQRAVVTELVNYSEDLADARFLWPEALVQRQGDPSGFGYVMALRPDGYAGLPDLFQRRVRTRPLELITACLLVVEAYQLLHSKGIAYRDISWGNVFFEPDTGEVLVCDTDNAVFEGYATGIVGTMEFMAPELVRADPGAAPGVQADLHSLAVLLFYMLINHHPLHGARELEIHCLEENAKKLLYGTEPTFMFDPSNSRNKAVEPEHQSPIALWEFIPAALRGLFVDAFTTGLRSPQSRVREIQWIEALSRCRDSIVSCRDCGRQNMTEPAGDLAEGGFGACWKCSRSLEPYAALSIEAPGRAVRHVLLNAETRVYAHQLGEIDRHDFQQLRAEVRRHPQRPDRLGLANLTGQPWEASGAGDAATTVQPGRSITLRDGLTLVLDQAKLAVRVYS